MTDRDTPEPTNAELALTRLADGTLPPDDADRLRARIEGDPELGARLAEQERAVTMVRAADVAAPDALRGRLEGMLGEAGASDGADQPPRAARSRRAPRRAIWRNTLFLPGATALAIVIVALVLLLGGGSHSPTVDQTAKLALSPATAPAPARDSSHPDLLTADVDGIPFPAYVETVGWRATGSRSDTVHRRHIVTVYYRAGDGTRVGYSIVPGKALTNPGGAGVVRHGVRYTFGRAGNGRYVTWDRDGHTCVIAGVNVSNRALLRLASADEQIGV
jgi:hypothetical protein